MLLALADPVARERYLTAHPLNRRTRQTITDMDELREELAVTAARGYAMDQEEHVEGVCCLAVPINDGAVPFAVGISSPSNRFATAESRYLSLMRRAVSTMESA
jgi:DNA-binding IclR family transcriptional regulator